MKKENRDIIILSILSFAWIIYEQWGAKSTHWSLFIFTFLYLTLTILPLLQFKKNAYAFLRIAISLTFFIRLGFMWGCINESYEKFINSINSFEINTILSIWSVALLCFGAIKLYQSCTRSSRPF